MLRKELYKQYKNLSGIYKLIINGKFYIGSAVNIGIRLSKHLLDLERNKHHSIYLQRSWNKYQKISVEIVELCDNLIEREQYYIDLLNPVFNLCLNARNCTGVVRSQETKDKISNHHKENKQYWKSIYKNRNFKHSEETKKRIGEASKGRKFSKETREKLSKAKSLSDEIIFKIKELRKTGISITKTAKELGISTTAVKKYQK